MRNSEEWWRFLKSQLETEFTLWKGYKTDFWEILQVLTAFSRGVVLVAPKFCVQSIANLAWGYVCMYLCMYVCMYVCMYLCVYVVCMYVCMHVFMNVCMYVCMYVGMYVCMYVCIYVCRCMYVCGCMRHILASIFMCVCAQVLCAERCQSWMGVC